MTGGSFDIKDLERRMAGASSVLQQEFGGLRTGRASAGLLDPITVNAYGSKMPLNQVASVSVPDARTISVQVWDQTQVQAVDKAHRGEALTDEEWSALPRATMLISKAAFRTSRVRRGSARMDAGLYGGQHWDSVEALGRSQRGTVGHGPGRTARRS